MVRGRAKSPFDLSPEIIETGDQVSGGIVDRVDRVGTLNQNDLEMRAYFTKIRVRFPKRAKPGQVIWKNRVHCVGQGDSLLSVPEFYSAGVRPPNMMDMALPIRNLRWCYGMKRSVFGGCRPFG